MIRRWSIFGLGFILLSLPFSYMIVTSKEQGPRRVVSEGTRVREDLSLLPDQTADKRP